MDIQKEIEELKKSKELYYEIGSHFGYTSCQKAISIINQLLEQIKQLEEKLNDK